MLQFYHCTFFFSELTLTYLLSKQLFSTITCYTHTTFHHKPLSLFSHLFSQHLYLSSVTPIEHRTLHQYDIILPSFKQTSALFIEPVLTFDYAPHQMKCLLSSILYVQHRKILHFVHQHNPSSTNSL